MTKQANGKHKKPLYTLIPFEDFKALNGVDDRDDKQARFHLVTSTFSIEQYCKRRLLRKKHIEQIEFTGDLLLPFKEYPVNEVLAVYLVKNPHPCGFLTMDFAEQNPAKALETPPSMAGEILEQEFYHVLPDCGTEEDIPFNLSLSPALLRYRKLQALKIIYWAGYAQGKVPSDIVSACFELAAWNMSRFKNKRIGVQETEGKDQLELSMPQNVRLLLEPYRRRTI
jgi:hypothetical protein